MIRAHIQIQLRYFSRLKSSRMNFIFLGVCCGYPCQISILSLLYINLSSIGASTCLLNIYFIRYILIYRIICCQTCGEFLPLLNMIKRALNDDKLKAKECALQHLIVTIICSCRIAFFTFWVWHICWRLKVLLEITE